MLDCRFVEDVKTSCIVAFVVVVLLEFVLSVSVWNCCADDVMGFSRIGNGPGRV